MRVLDARFQLAVGSKEQLPAADLPEIALLGRSNVGKSSLLNSLLSRNLAHTSKTPGRTRTLNFYRVMLPGTFLPGERQSKTIELYLVDLPGYGYAKVSGEILQQWPALIEPYLQSRTTLAASVLLIDAMVPPQASDLDLYHWLSRRGRRVQVVATKCDRLSKNQRRSAIKNLEEAFGSPILAFSARTSEGREALLQAITSWLI